MCFNPGPERRVPSPNRYIADAKFCFCKNNKTIIINNNAGRADGWVGDFEEMCTLHAVIMLGFWHKVNRPPVVSMIKILPSGIMPTCRILWCLTLSINQPFIVLTETKFSYRYIPVWARYSPHRTRVEAHANTLSP